MDVSNSEYEDGYRRLLCAVVIQAVRDLDSQEHQHEANLFFTTDWFEWMVRTLDMNPIELARKIKAGEYVAPKQSPYHTSSKQKPSR